MSGPTRSNQPSTVSARRPTAGLLLKKMCPQQPGSTGFIGSLRTVRRPNRKGNIIRVYAIQRHIERSEIYHVHWNNVDAVLAPCWVTASVEFMERAGYLPISPDISSRIRSRLSEIGTSVTALNPLFDSR